MKNYRDYIFENATLPDFENDYVAICDKINEFWVILDDRLEDLEEFNMRNAQDVFKKNSTPITPVKPVVKKQNNPPKQKPKPPEKMKNGKLVEYNYVTNSGKKTIVTIDTPDNGMNTNTALVKPLNKPTSKTYPVTWDRLTPLVPVSTT